MAARDRFSVVLQCPACGASGAADLSEKDHPWARDLDRRIDDITPGFTVETLTPFVARCGKCNVVATK